METVPPAIACIRLLTFAAEATAARLLLAHFLLCADTSEQTYFQSEHRTSQRCKTEAEPVDADDEDDEDGDDGEDDYREGEDELTDKDEEGNGYPKDYSSKKGPGDSAGGSNANGEDEDDDPEEQDDGDDDDDDDDEDDDDEDVGEDEVVGADEENQENDEEDEEDEELQPPKKRKK